MAKILKNDELNNMLTEYYDIMDISKEQKLERIELAEELFDVFFFLFTYVEAQIQASVSVEIDKESMYEMFDRRYVEACEEYGINLDRHPEIRNHISMVSKEIVDSTIDGYSKNHSSNNSNPNRKNEIQTSKSVSTVTGDGKKTSSNNGVKTNPNQSENQDIKQNTENKIQERALSVAQNESNSVLNRNDYDDAVSNKKYTKKTWLTELDNKVRQTHKDIESLTISIDEPFQVGDSQMMFPHDSSLGASASELVNCRCSVRYS